MKQKRKARLLEGVVIEEVSLVKRGANNKRIFFAKSAERKETDQKIDVDIRTFAKKDDNGNDFAFIDSETGERMHVLKCVLYEPDVADLQDDIMTEQEIANAYYNFAKNYGDIKHNHSGESGYASFVGGGIELKDTKICDEFIKKGSAVIDIAVDDKTFELYKSGEIDSVSMGGYFTTSKEVEIEKTMKEDNEKLGVLKFMAKFLGFGEITISDEKPENDNRNNENNNNNDGEIDMTIEELTKMLDERDAKAKEELAKSAEATKVVSVDDYEKLKKEFADYKDGEKARLAEIEKTYIARVEAIEKSEKALSEKATELEKSIKEIIENSGEPTTASPEDNKANPVVKSFADLIKSNK